MIDPVTYDDDTLKALAVLSNAKGSNGDGWLSAADIAKTLRDSHSVNVHWRVVRNLLLADKKLVHRRKRGGHWQFAIMQPGVDLLNANKSDILYVDPTQAVAHTMRLHSVLSAVQGIVRVCDAYLDATTIEHLEACVQTVPIRLLTKNIKDNGPLRRVIAAAKLNRTLEIRQTNAALHDRYIIDDNQMLILGTSLNGFGKKQCFIINAGPDIRATLLTTFDAHWNSAIPWP